jgi:hypothetical protein
MSLSLKINSLSLVILTALGLTIKKPLIQRKFFINSLGLKGLNGN